MVAAVVLHQAAGWHYPVPWDDEAHFLAPAQSLVQHLSLTAPQINAPEGIFWMPDGYAAVIAVFYAVLPDTVATARLLSLGFTLAFAGCLYALTARASATGHGARLAAACAAALWLASPLVVLMGNIARMEALVLALTGAALLLIAAGRWAGALAVVALTPLVHPMGLALFVMLACAAVLVRADLRPSGRTQIIIVVLVGLAWIAEIAWLATHFVLLRAHLGYQLALKSSRGPAVGRYQLVAALAAVAGLIGAATGRSGLGRQRAEALAAVCAVAGGLIAVEIAGNMMWYRVLGHPTVLLLAAVAAALAWPRRSVVASRPRLAAVMGAAVAVAAVASVGAAVWRTMTSSAFGMAISAGTTSGDDAFLTAVERELHRFDARQPHPMIVALDWSSGLMPFLLEQRWDNLRFVDPTPVTPLTHQPDYVLFSVHPGEPDWRRHIDNRLPHAAPVLHLDFPDSQGELLVYPGALTRLPLH
jgi:hypothetical protein